MARNQITIDRLRLFGALKRSKNMFVNDVKAIEKIIDNMRKDKECHYLSASQDDFSKVSYAKNKTDRLNNNNRIKTTFGRYVRRKINIKDKELSDTTLSKLSEFVSISIGKKKDENISEFVKVLKGKDIVKFYKNTNKTLHTCMTGTSKSKLINFYALNPDKVSLVVTHNNKARALLWTTDSGEKVLDRIYPNAGVNMNKIKTWAEANKIKSPYKNHRITMKHNGYFPYLDRFKYGKFDDLKKAASHKSGTVILSANQSYGNAELVSTDGRFYNVNVCCSCEKKIPRYNGYTVYGALRISFLFCGNCFKSKVKTCGYCTHHFISSEVKSLHSLLNINKKLRISTNDNICTACIKQYNSSLRFTCDICNNKETELGTFYIRNSRTYNEACVCIKCINKIS